MQQWRIEEFQHNTGRRFPSVRTMATHDAKIVARRLLSRLGYTESIEEPRLWATLEEALVPVPTTRATEPTFSLGTVFGLAGITPNADMHIWWQQEHDEVIDIMKTEDIVREFRWIWRPGSDDVDLFDASMSWLVRVDHSGVVLALIAKSDE